MKNPLHSTNSPTAADRAAGLRTPGGLPSKSGHVPHNLVNGCPLECVAGALCAREGKGGGLVRRGQHGAQQLAEQPGLLSVHQAEKRRTSGKRPMLKHQAVKRRDRQTNIWTEQAAQQRLAPHLSSGCGRPLPPRGRCRQTARSPAGLHGEGHTRRLGSRALEQRHQARHRRIAAPPREQHQRGVQPAAGWSP